MQQRKYVQTTLGDLIVEITEEARHYTRNVREAYALTAAILAHILNRPGVDSRRAKEPAIRHRLHVLKGNVSPRRELVTASALRLCGAPRGSLHVATE